MSIKNNATRTGGDRYGDSGQLMAMVIVTDGQW